MTPPQVAAEMAPSQDWIDESCPEWPCACAGEITASLRQKEREEDV